MNARDVAAVVIGGSAGALEALGEILPVLGDDFALPIAVVVHIPARRPSLLVEVLRAKCRLAVKEAEDKELFGPGTVYVAPPDYHLLIEKRGRCSLSVDELVHFSRPSIDVLFESAADAYGPRLIGVLLTGANEDGAAGLARIKQAGGTTAVQAPDSAAVATMPAAGLRLASPDHVLALPELGPLVARLGTPGHSSNMRRRS